MTIKSGAPTIMLMAILAQAQSIVTQNQTLGRLRAAAQNAPKVLKPGDRGFNGGRR
jgi:hypothetical protein